MIIQHDPKKRSSANDKSQDAIAAKLEKLELDRLKAEKNAQFSAYLAALPQLAYPKHYRVECINDVESTNKRLRQLMMLNEGEDKIFGLDLEWQPTFIKGKPENKVSLVQICDANSILLIQISRMPGTDKTIVHGNLLCFLTSL